MTQKEVSQVGNMVIRAMAKDVVFPLKKDDKQIIADLIDMMQTEHLVGMAAPQIGVSKRIFVTQPKKTKFRQHDEDVLRVFINPKIVQFSQETEIGYEGCGSVAEANIFGEVERSKSITIEWCEGGGKKYTHTFDGFLARVIQHELDHLDGVVFIDKLCTTQTLMSGSEFQKRNG